MSDVDRLCIAGIHSYADLGRLLNLYPAAGQMPSQPGRPPRMPSQPDELRKHGSSLTDCLLAEAVKV